MITELCLYLNNWFDRDQPKCFGDFEISDGNLVGDYGIAANQYYRIIGSKFNDGVYKHGSESLIDETFNGAVWLMAVPPDVVSLATEIGAWQEKYGDASPYQSESFNGYTYSKMNSATGNSVTWQTAFGDRLRGYKKI